MNIFWFRRDLRLEDNTALANALSSNNATLPIFIFDDHILNKLPANDPRVNFIYDRLKKLNNSLSFHKSGIKIFRGNILEIWNQLLLDYKIEEVFFNHDYEPYARKRDKDVFNLLKNSGVIVKNFKDQVIFEKKEVVKKDGLPYTVFTPFKNKWLERFQNEGLITNPEKDFSKLHPFKHDFPEKESLGIRYNVIKVKEWNTSEIESYEETRNFPSLDSTSYLGPHLRFGTVSIRQLVKAAQKRSAIFLSELIWREFFMQSLWNFPDSATNNFKPQYNLIEWRNNEKEFKKWCEGETGYPIVDAGMRELNSTGFMHNRVRMITASFLVKHLLIDWRWGEAYFAEKLLDYEQSSNVGNWQWAAGTGCDSSPYFRVFNPYEQVKKFDKDLKYIKKWVPEFQELTYTKPIVEHKLGRERAIKTYKEGLNRI
jgi:deoxyribodipyrimidine photo-lyase